MKFKHRIFAAVTITSLAFAAPALADVTCEAIEGDAPLYADQIAAFGQTIAPAGCDQAWSQAMRARRNANLRDGIVIREETWGILVEEQADNCAPDGNEIAAGSVARLSLRCETRYRCVDGVAEVTTETSCERAP